MINKTTHNGAQNYLAPAIEIATVEIEVGIAMSTSQQEPSPWEDM